MALEKKLIKMLVEILSLPESHLTSMSRDTLLMGEIPEFDSMAVVSVITTMEEQFGIAVDDEDISAETFESVGSLTDYLNNKLTQ